ncbi:MAG TPA: hypothetical protein VKD91_17260 [Pyrinomonadaceae bacterium]|nr:hypothetical protein [Pyrinomonadaceae bacterium]
MGNGSGENNIANMLEAMQVDDVRQWKLVAAVIAETFPVLPACEFGWSTFCPVVVSRTSTGTMLPAKRLSCQRRVD